MYVPSLCSSCCLNAGFCDRVRQCVITMACGATMTDCETRYTTGTLILLLSWGDKCGTGGASGSPAIYGMLNDV
jgi:hypothetical protein